MTALKEKLRTSGLKASAIVIVFLIAYFADFDKLTTLPALLPLKENNFGQGLFEALFMLQEYAREHVLLCLLPAFFIAGAIANFIQQGAVLKYLGSRANKVIAYTVASVSGAVLAVCSCTVLPLFASIHKRGAGLGPAVAFLYAGPAINALAIILTARVLGVEIGIARAVGAVFFAIILGLLMSRIFHKEEEARANEQKTLIIPDAETDRPLVQTALPIAFMLAILVFVNWGRDASESIPLWNTIFAYKYAITGIFGALLIVTIFAWFKRDERSAWMAQTFDFALQILPLLFVGVLVAGFLLGRPDHGGIIPKEWVANLVGGNSVMANTLASVAGAFMYFATLTEVPIIEGLLGMGMGKGPALALLLAGPALSLPNMLVIRSVLGTKKTVVFVLLVITLSTFAGLVFGAVIA